MDEIRQTIARLEVERSTAARLTGRALVNQAEVRRICGEQLRLLSEAAHEAQRGEQLARSIADELRAEAESHGTDPASDLYAYERTAAALAGAQVTLDLAAGPVRALLAGADDNAQRARQVLTRTQRAFDEQVRVQIRLLIELERVERARIARSYRR